MRWATFVHSARVVDHLPNKLTQAGFSRSVLKKADSVESISVLIFSSRAVKRRNFFFKSCALSEDKQILFLAFVFLANGSEKLPLIRISESTLLALLFTDHEVTIYSHFLLTESGSDPSSSEELPCRRLSDPEADPGLSAKGGRGENTQRKNFNFGKAKGTFS